MYALTTVQTPILLLDFGLWTPVLISGLVPQGTTPEEVGGKIFRRRQGGGIFRSSEVNFQGDNRTPVCSSSPLCFLAIK